VVFHLDSWIQLLQVLLIFQILQLHVLAKSTIIIRVQILIVDHCLFAPTLRYEKLKKIKGLEGLATCSKELQICDVIMLSEKIPSSLMQKLLKYLSNVHQMYSIFLQCLPLQSLGKVSVKKVLLLASIVLFGLVWIFF